jgi:hypothetical protein
MGRLLYAAFTEAVRITETSANFYETIRRNIPEGCHLHTRRHENLKAHIFNIRLATMRYQLGWIQMHHELLELTRMSRSRSKVSCIFGFFTIPNFLTSCTYCGLQLNCSFINIADFSSWPVRVTKIRAVLFIPLSHILKTSPLVPATSQMNPVHIVTHYFLKMHFNIILTSVLKYHKRSLSSVFRFNTVSEFLIITMLSTSPAHLSLYWSQ